MNGDYLLKKIHTLIDGELEVEEYANEFNPIFYKIEVYKLRSLRSFIVGGYEWCEENNIDPLNMSEEDIVAFKLRWL